MQAAPWGLIDARPILRKLGPGDHSVAAIATAQHGSISRPQLEFVGVSSSAISYRSRNGRLLRVHRGIYLVGHEAVPDIGRIAAAVLACGSGSAASHRAAGFVYGLLRFDPDMIDVSVQAAGRRDRQGIRVHESSAIGHGDIVGRNGVPLTMPARTVLDVAGAEGREEGEHALNEARVQRLATREHFVALFRRTPGHRGWRFLKPLLREDDTDDFSRREAEKALYRLIRRAELPTPRRNIRVHGIELDFYWPALRLNVEMDGYQWHSARNRLNRDRDRDTFLAANGIQVVRFSRDQLKFTPEKVIARLAAAIALASAAKYREAQGPPGGSERP